MRNERSFRMIEKESMEDKRTAILQATLTLISEQGFHGTPMSMIARQAGVGAGTIYRYFENKETLIEELYFDLKTEMSKAMIAGLSTQDSTEQKFRKVWTNTFGYCIQNPASMEFLEQFHNSPFYTPEIEAKTMRVLTPLVQAFEAAIANGEIKELPFEMLTTFVYDIALALAKKQLAGKLDMDAHNVTYAVQACWDAVRGS